MGKPTLSFEIVPTYNSKLLIVADMSDWKHLEGESTYIDITLPGSKTGATLPFQKHKLNKFNSGNLSYGCTINCEEDLVSLPDGIYTIKIYVCEGNKFYQENHYLRTVLLETKLMRILVGMNLECNPNEPCVTQVLLTKLLLDGAKADLMFGNIKSANSKFKKACELVEDLEKCNCENGNGNLGAIFQYPAKCQKGCR